jgi:hypothetical protein
MAITNRACQQIATTSGSDPACPIFGANPVTGDTVEVWYSSFATGGVTHIAPTDSQFNTYTQIGTTQAGASGNFQLSLWRAENITGGANFVVTGHFAAAVTATVIATCITDTNTPTNYNGDTVAATGTSVNPASGASTPAPAADSYFTAGTSKGANGVATAGSGWNFYTLSTQTDNVSFQDLYVEERFPSSTVQNGQFTCASENWIARVASFAPRPNIAAIAATDQLNMSPQQRMG